MAPAHVSTPPLPDSSRMVPTTATVSTMPDMCGSIASRITTGIRGSTGTTSCFHTRTRSHSRGGKQDAALRVQPLHLRCLGCKMGTEQDHLKLCHLRGLQRKACKTDPAAAAVQGCHSQGDGQHGQHDDVPRHHHLAQKTVIHIAYQEHTAQPQVSCTAPAA